MQKTVTAALVAALLSLTGAALAGTGIDLQANETPIHAPKNPQAIAKLPADFHFVKPGQFTVAVAALNTPPLTVFADDNKTTARQRGGYRPAGGRQPGAGTLNVVPTSWEDWPLGVASGKYDAAISNITVTKERKNRSSTSPPTAKTPSAFT